MEDCITSFFTNGIKLHLESSFNKLNDIKSLIFNEDFENYFLEPIFINNINLFRDLISQNNLNFSSFWKHIGKLIRGFNQDLIKKFEEEINEEKKNINDDNKLKIGLGEDNILKLKLLNISLYLITSIESDDFLDVKNKEKDTLEALLNSYIKINLEKNEDFSTFIKDYMIKIFLLINNNSSKINIGFLKYLSFDFYNMMQSTANNEKFRHLKVYIDQVINNPKVELNKCLNVGAFNKKIIKKERISRSRGASFDIRDPYNNVNINNNVEKNNKKIVDFFKKDKKVTSTNKSTSKKNNNNEYNEYESKKPESKISSYSFCAKNLVFPSGSELNLMNFGSGISNISNYSLGNNGNASNKISLDDSFSINGLFPKPITELENKDTKDKFKNFFFKCPVIPTFARSRQFRKKKPAEKIRDKALVDIRKFINKKRKNENDDEKEMKELREMINSSFYGNESEENIINLDENVNKKEIKNKPEVINNNIEGKEDNKENKDNSNILIFKTPTKVDKLNQENVDNNIINNIDMNGIQRNFKALFEQRIFS